jgi:spore maturation protein CgeB
MRWLLVMGFDREADFGLDFRDELRAMGHEVRTFAYRRNNALYKNRSTKAPYQRLLLHRLRRLCEAWRPAVVLVLKGGPINAGLIQRVKSRIDTLFLNVFPDNPLWMIPFEHLEPYDIFFTKERYAMRQLQLAGLRNLYYLPLYCVPAAQHPVDLSAEERRPLDGVVALVGRAYPWRARFVRELAAYPVRLWGPGWHRVTDPRVRALVAGGAVWGADKLKIHSGARLSLNPHHPMNDIVGVNIRTFELAATGSCQVVDLKDDLSTLFKPGEELVAYRDLAELRRALDHYLAHPDEARAIGENARRRAIAEHTLRHRLDEILFAVEERFGKRW